MILKNGKILSPEGKFIQEDMAFQDTIQEIGTVSAETDSLDLSGCYVVPGLIDLHTHGGMGKDASDGLPENMEILSQYYASVGVTSWLPTTMTLQEETLTKAVKAIGDYKNPIGAKPVGIYLEGPFFHFDKKGAQSARNLAKPDFDMVQRLNEASGGMVSVLALAPELEDGLETVEKASKICTVALGHTTADYDTATTAFDKGATLVTHLFNGMMPFAHRTPALVGAAFDAQAYVEIICDGLHIHPSVLRASHKLFGKRLCLISDSLRCAGMPDGDYELGGQPIEKKGGVATLKDGTLAGSCIGLIDGVHQVISFGFAPEDAFYAASTAPAHAIGKESTIGSLSVGKSADFLILDQDYKLKSTYVNGKEVYTAP